jgi:hypothetical protein
MMTSLLVCLTSMIGAGQDKPSPIASPSVEHAARLYRIAVYDSFRLDRPEYNLRREAGDFLWQVYEKSAKSPEVAAETLAWFDAARNAAIENVGSLPPLPLFVEAEQIANGFDDADGVPVTTSAQEDKLRLGLDGGEPSLHIELPKDAEQTGTSRFFSRLVKQTFDVLLSSPSEQARKPKQPADVLISPGVAPPAKPAH